MTGECSATRSPSHVLPNVGSVWGKRLLPPELEGISDSDAGCRDACSMLSQPLLVGGGGSSVRLTGCTFENSVLTNALASWADSRSSLRLV
jgi:hypothetical protein